LEAVSAIFERHKIKGVAVIKQCLASALALSILSASAGQPNAIDIAACLSGKSQGLTTVTEIRFQDLNEEDDYWKGYTATTVVFRGKAVGYAKKGEAEGLAFNGRVYPIAQATPINIPRPQFNELVKHGSVGVSQASDWYWLKGKQQFVCVATNRSMEKATPILFFLSTGKHKRVYVVEGA
jgi:hypothetical protein